MTLRASVGSTERASPESAGRLAAAAAAGPLGRERVRTLIVFCTGAHASQAEAVARGAREVVSDAVVAVVGGPGALTPDGDVGPGAAVALALDVPSQAAVAGLDAAETLGRSLRHRPARPILVFGKRAIPPERLASFVEAAGASAVAGGGAEPSASLAVAVPDGAVSTGDLLAMRIDGGLRMALAHSVAVHPLGPLWKVTGVEKGYVTALEGQPPLSRLGRAVRDRQDRPLVLVRWRPQDAPAAESFSEADLAALPGAGLSVALGGLAGAGLGPTVEESSDEPLTVVRGIGGIDPEKGAVYVGRDVRVGDELGYCVPDARAGREDLKASLQRLDADLCGGIPVAALVLDSVGRGSQLYGKAHVDARAIRRHFDELPFAGVRTASELVSLGPPRVAGHSAVIALLFRPS